MPTLLTFNGLRFFFYSNESNEPTHIHVSKGNANGKIWLEPTITIAYLYGFSNNEERDIMIVIEEYSTTFKQKWYEFFRK
jgi:hypothetical protein